MANPLSLGNSVFGAASTTGTGVTTVIAAPQGAQRIMVTDIQLGNTSASSVAITLNDSASTVIVAPANGSSNIHFETPLIVAANTAFTFKPGAGTTTAYCSAQGYLAPGGTI